MEAIELFLPSSNKLVHDYITNTLDTYKFFDYDIHSPLVYELRKKEINKRDFPREELVNYLLSYNKRYHCHDNTIENINKLSDRNSVVVIGGQQAGVLTGPLYSIHKIISILNLAKQQEERLGIPVVPVFWIAGEDHDFAEINHVFVKEKESIKKKILPQQHFAKSMVSNIHIDKDSTTPWIKEVFETYGETEYTKQLLDMLEVKLEQSETYVDFFANIINELFQDSGLVLLDSGSQELRNIEAKFMREMIEKNKQIHDALRSQQEVLLVSQYQNMIQANEYSANLFYHVNGERVLLEYNAEHDIFKGKNNECILCGEELIEITHSNPENISNNVVTRPLMQELLFPTLAFISGPGEISYWAELKKVFEVMGIKMPPVVPRLMITLLERSIESHLDDIGLTISEGLTGKLPSVKDEWISRNTSNFDELITNAKFEVEKIHQRIRSAVLKEEDGAYELLLKNAEVIQNQFEFLRNTVNKRILQKHDVELKRFTRIETSLVPTGAPQERVWNIFYYVNKYGHDFVTKLTEVPFEFNGKHKVVKI